MSDAPVTMPDTEYRGFVRWLPAAARPYALLARFDRPIGWWLLYWPCAWSVLLAGGLRHAWPLLLWFLLGSIAMRGAGCVYNDIVDRDLDAQVARTRNRPLPSGAVSLRAAWVWLVALCLIGLIVLLQLPRFAQIVALASLAPVAAYPFMKRITWWPQAWLGIVFSWGALVGWSAVMEDISAPLVLLYAGCIAWVIGYDTIYALQDIEDDALVGVKSTARRMGARVRQGVALFYALALVLWAAAFWLVRPDPLVFATLIPMAAHLVWQVATLNPADGANALARFRSNRDAGVLMALACLVTDSKREGMFTKDQAQNYAADAVARAMRGGADAADSVVVASGSTSVEVRLGKVEGLGRSESNELGLRVFVGKRSASASTSDLSTAALDALVERTVAMARLAPDDPYAGLASADLLASGPFADFDLDDGVDVEPEALKERALAAEDAARAVSGVTNSEGAGASHGTGVSAIATSNGFAGAQSGSSHSVSASVLAGEGARMQRDWHAHSARHLSDLEDAAAVGTEAGERAVARLDPVRLKSGPMPVVYDPRVSSSLLGHFVGAITGSAIARKTSFLIDRLGKPVFAPGIRIIDDPHRMRGSRSRAFDSEGLPTRAVALIDDGVLTGWIAEVASAKQLGIAPTGHAGRGVSGPPGAGTSNLHLEPGTLTPAELMADIVDGFYVTELIGMGVNGLTGDYSRGAAGFHIIDGQIAGAVAEVTIAGNLKDMFAALIPASDLEFRHATNAPTVRIDGMMLAGA